MRQKQAHIVAVCWAAGKLTVELSSALLCYALHSPSLTPCLVPPQFPKSCYNTCHIECLRAVHGALNIDEKEKLITQFGGKLRDERFEPN